MRRLWWCAICLAGCGGSAPPAAPATPPRAEPVVVSKRAAPRPAGVLWREEVLATVDLGLGAFLQHAELEPALEDGRFIGFRVVRLMPPEWWAGVDLQPGDVVTHVNDTSIERDIDAYRVFTSLKTAERLNVRYFRNATERRLEYKIVPRPAGS